MRGCKYARMCVYPLCECISAVGPRYVGVRLLEQVSLDVASAVSKRSCTVPEFPFKNHGAIYPSVPLKCKYYLCLNVLFLKSTCINISV